MKFSKIKLMEMLGIALLTLFIACNQDEPAAPQALETVGEKIFDSITIEDQKFLNIKNDSGGVYIYGYPNQDVIETMLYRTVSAESKTLAEKRLDDVRLEHSKSDDNVNLFTTIDAQPGRLRYTSWYNLEIPAKMVLNIDELWEDLTVFDMDTMLTVTNAGHNISIVRHNGSAQVHTRAGDIYMEIAIPDSGFCRGETGAGDVVVRVPQETSAQFKLVSHQGIVSVNNLEVKDQVERPELIEGVLGLGEGEIILETSRGSIVLNGL